MALDAAGAFTALVATGSSVRNVALSSEQMLRTALVSLGYSSDLAKEVEILAFEELEYQEMDRIEQVHYPYFE